MTEGKDLEPGKLSDAVMIEREDSADGKRYESLSQVRVSSFPMPTCDKVYVNCENDKTIKLKVGSSGPFSSIEIHAAYLNGEKLEVDTLGNLHVPMIRRGVRARQFGRQGWSNLGWRS